VKITNLCFKQFVVVFWFLWWVCALWTDIIGAVAHFGNFQASWAPDINYPYLVKAVAMYNVVELVPIILYAGIILLSGISCILFFRAVISLTKPYEIWMKKAQSAFIFTLGFWILFFLADQIVMKYMEEQNHMVQGGFELLTYLALYILPNE
jgi:hypothetical protein